MFIHDFNFFVFFSFEFFNIEVDFLILSNDLFVNWFPILHVGSFKTPVKIILIFSPLNYESDIVSFVWIRKI